MTIATFAFILGMLELLCGLPMLLAPAATRDWLLRMVKDDLLYRVIGGFSLILCGLPLFDKPSISADLAGAIRVIAWWGVIKSLVICWSPGWLIPLGERMLSGPARCRIWGVVAIAAGAVFAWAGFTLASG